MLVHIRKYHMNKDDAGLLGLSSIDDITLDDNLDNDSDGSVESGEILADEEGMPDSGMVRMNCVILWLIVELVLSIGSCGSLGNVYFNGPCKDTVVYELDYAHFVWSQICSFVHRHIGLITNRRVLSRFITSV